VSSLPFFKVVNLQIGIAVSEVRMLRDDLRKVGRSDALIVCENRRTLDDIREFANIPRPLIVAQSFSGTIRHSPILTTGPPKKMIDK
jgi:hypothetical protein